MATQSAHTWSKPVITDRGLVLRQKAIDNKLDLKFTKAQVGTGKPSDPNNIGKMTALVTPQKLAKVMRSFADDKGMFTQTVRVENTGYQSSIPVTEIGVFATIVGTGEEVLYSYIYCVSGVVAIPPASEHYYSHDIQLNTGVGLTDKVTLVYDGTGVFVDHDELDEHNKSPLSHPNKVNGKWTVFESLESLGINTGTETIKKIIKEMPERSTLYYGFNIDNGNVASEYPIKSGTMQIIKFNNVRAVITAYDSGSNGTWRATYYQGQDVWVPWEQFSLNQTVIDFINLHNNNPNAHKLQISTSINSHDANINAHKKLFNSKMNGDWTYYNSLSSIGIQVGRENLKEIVRKLPKYSTLYYDVNVEKGNASDQYPMKFGLIKIEKLHGARSIVTMFSESRNEEWRMTYYEPTNIFSDWEQRSFNAKTVSKILSTQAEYEAKKIAKYRKSNQGLVSIDIVELHRRDNAQFSQGTRIFAILPVGYRPVYLIEQPVHIKDDTGIIDTNAYGIVSVTPKGEVRLSVQGATVKSKMTSASIIFDTNFQ